MNNNHFFTEHFKLTIGIMSISLLILLWLVSKLFWSILNYEPTNLSPEFIPAQYAVEDIEDLHINEPFKLSNYYITNHYNYGRYYYLDQENTLWGYGDGQLSNIDIFEATSPVKIGEKVIHVDSNSHVTLFLTEDGNLYGLGNNYLGLLLLESEDGYPKSMGYALVETPVLLMEDVSYARCGQETIIVLKKDGSVWWWGEICTATVVSGTNYTRIFRRNPVKVMENAVYVTAGLDNLAVIKNDGSLWTWGYNSLGTCGILSGDYLIDLPEDQAAADITNGNFIASPTRVMDNVKMVWFDKPYFNHKVPKNLEFQYKYTTYNYEYTIFVEKNDGSLWACGENIVGPNSRIQNIHAIGEVLCSFSFEPIILYQTAQN